MECKTSTVCFNASFTMVLKASAMQAVNTVSDIMEDVKVMEALRMRVKVIDGIKVQNRKKLCDTFSGLSPT